ncbi:Reductase [Klebsiella pneumoniae]|nr:Reductase [Klebsiella pneumoniae]
MTKIALITGANRGLGRQTALDIARQGGDVIVTYRGSLEQAEAVVADIRALGRKAIALPLDMAQTASFPASPTASAARWPASGGGPLSTT